ncbi:hypothetical protein GT037_009124 [Alternaria burnsii]|uniref:WSC domain-containing protein n=1 Tax=Alternaria burnsii TaxID=1187904 RepID=A0A8H7AXQ6_9PLEO|nr:uncharacterized protein GT037_009124 [Alternaria burnsii]KAF7672623.1 hypothetical protein GT037_009124 [Alternaria burnsii]
MDPSLGEHSCSCTCSNGLRFEQSLPSYSPQSGGSSSNGSLDACQAAQDKFFAREQELLAEIEAYKPKLPKYIGCYIEQAHPNSILTGRRLASKSLTFEQCAMHCEDYKYFGLEPDLCWCGNELKFGVTIVEDKECNDFCAGNRTQQCGASWRTAIYKITE